MEDGDQYLKRRVREYAQMNNTPQHEIALAEGGWLATVHSMDIHYVQFYSAVCSRWKL